jgi:predicted DNA-binding ribbon-helix-helix protein
MNPAPAPAAAMLRRTVRLGRRGARRLRLERCFWTMLTDVAGREGMTTAELITEIDRRRGGLPLPDALRAFGVDYFRRAALNCGDLDKALAEATGGETWKSSTALENPSRFR